MSMETFRTAIYAAMDYGSYITIGGGEPTLHPDILAMIGMAAMVSEEAVFMVTNGTCSEKVWRSLMGARDKEILHVRVSNDLWHDTSMLQPWVIRDANKYKLWWGDPSLGQRTLVKRGRAVRNWSKLLQDCRLSGIEVEEIETECGDPRIDPNGLVWPDVPNYGSTGSIYDSDSLRCAYDIIREYEGRQLGDRP